MNPDLPPSQEPPAQPSDPNRNLAPTHTEATSPNREPQASPKHPLYWILKYVCQIGYVLYFKGRVFGLRNVPQTGGVLLASNHQSFVDPICAGVGLNREADFMARDTLFLNPYFSRLISSLNAFPVKRGAADVGAVKEILRRLKAGKLVVVFPEGTRTMDGKIGKINANSLLIAKKARATIVPTVIDGAFESWPRTRLLPSPHRVYVTYCEAITPAQVESWPIDRTAETVQKRMHAALAQSQAMRRGPR